MGNATSSTGSVFRRKDGGQSSQSGATPQSSSSPQGDKENSGSKKNSIVEREKMISIVSRVRRGKVFAETVNLDEDFVCPVYPKGESVLEFLNESLEGNFLFDSLSKKEKSSLIDAMQREPIPRGIGIIQQGDIGDYFYVVEEGTVVFEVDFKPVGKCSRGACFGELALLYNCPRAATCLAETDTILWKVDQKTFRYMIANNIDQETKGIRDVLKKVPFLSELDEATMTKVSDALTPIAFSEGKRIVSKGDIGEVFYILKEGTVKVHDIGFGDSHYVDQMLGPGDFFGERALLTGEPRAANVTAMTDCTTLCLSRDAFEKTLGNLQHLMDLAIRKRIMMGMPTFASSELHLYEIDELALLFNEQSFQEQYVLTRAGEPIQRQALYIIESGQVTIVDDKGKITTLNKGDHFGGQTIKRPRGAISDRTVQFNQTTICSVLTKENIEHVIKDMSRLGRPASFIKKLNEQIKMSDLVLYNILGTGTFGKVRLVYHKDTNTAYALKTLSKVQIIRHKQSTAVIREKNIMATTNHPLILNLIATYQDEHFLYMLTDLVQGGELFSVIHTDKRDGVPHFHAQFYAACVFEALSHLHARHICYRDLKPENVLVDKVGYCILIDMGFAKVVMEKTFTLCGTPEYLAPEVILSKGHNKGVDYWALGILIFEFLAGYTPFFSDGVDQMTLFKRIVRSRFDFPRHKEFNAVVEDLISQLLHRNQTQRVGCLARGDRDVKEHVWFRSVDFDKLVKKEIEAPWLPKLKDDMDRTYFGDFDHVEAEDDSDAYITLNEDQQEVFEEF